MQREYYVNDAGRQMHILALSVWLRYLERRGQAVPFPSNGYRGAYVREIAAALEREAGGDFAVDAEALMHGVPADDPDGGDKEAHVDALIARARSLLGAERYDRVFALAREMEVADIRRDLEEFGVTFDEWFSERSLVDAGDVGRPWSASGSAATSTSTRARYGSARPPSATRRIVSWCARTVESTYFASDVAYAANKFERGFERAIYVWGADHHGYIARVKAAAEALGYDRQAVEILIVQFAVLYRGGERMQMSTRSGEFVTLRELREEVGADAARFFYVMRRCEQHLDFDLELAKSQSSDNPVYYVQYAHARISSVLRQCAERGLSRGQGRRRRSTPLWKPSRSPSCVRLRSTRRCWRTRRGISSRTSSQRTCGELATQLHGFYNAHTFLVAADAVRGARLSLAVATRTVLADGLALLGGVGAGIHVAARGR